MTLPDKTILLTLTGIDRSTLEAVALFGDFDLLAPAALLLGGLLWWRGARREAVAWLAALVVCALVVGVLKETVGSFKIHVFHEFRAASFPSGHAAFSFAFYGGLALLAWRRRAGAGAGVGVRLAAAALLAVPVLVTLSVWLLRWHPIIDAAVGTMVGLAAIRLCAALLDRPEAKLRTI
jgi:membrane-associated phospholipid phosphatase